MECVCGCGREISGAKDTEQNLTAATIALELLGWDKNRASPSPGPDGREGLIARGADCYQRLLYSLHKGGGVDPGPECEEWLRESGEMRVQRSDLTKKRFLGRGFGVPNVTDHDMQLMDRHHPELSFTGMAGTGAAAAATDGRDDLVDQLERLRTLREDGVLTDEEFAAAKARLLG
jgi:hypothetical protein